MPEAAVIPAGIEAWEASLFPSCTILFYPYFFYIYSPWLICWIFTGLPLENGLPTWGTYPISVGKLLLFLKNQMAERANLERVPCKGKQKANEGQSGERAGRGGRLARYRGDVSALGARLGRSKKRVATSPGPSCILFTTRSAAISLPPWSCRSTRWPRNRIPRHGHIA